MIILAIASFLGLIGSARKVSTLVRVYFFALLAAWVLGIGLGTAYTTDTFIHRDEIIQICQARQEKLWTGNEALIKLGQDACRFVSTSIALQSAEPWIADTVTTLCCTSALPSLRRNSSSGRQSSSASGWFSMQSSCTSSSSHLEHLGSSRMKVQRCKTPTRTLEVILLRMDER